MRDIEQDVLDFLPKSLVYDRLAIANRSGTIVVKDKIRFRQVMEAHGLPCIREILVLRPGGEAVGPDGETLSMEEAAARLRAAGDRLFVKPVGRYGGEGARRFHPGRDRLEDLAAERDTLIVQPLLRQHPALDRLHPGSVNTIRIDSLLLGDECVHNAATLRIGAGGSVVDSASRGGIMVPIDLATGRLAARGRREIPHGAEFLPRHPDTGIEFAGVRVPHWDAVLRLVKAGSFALRPLGSLGWDIAMTSEGPVAIEANAWWGPEVFQLFRGLRPTPLGRMVTGPAEEPAAGGLMVARPRP